ncbi:hypothetical protein BGW36DRAFT_429461 [Talaromyces proteolyticus]|uniref:Uncharacterized protein n=1 Tax=Talaromyces proteolyticus TaxID=1131652 RepID=A0AAD4KPY9_9EURO|nr:uncharacterized protein BGW36DRAFT_429461 [Talaromyces proteolyticus]KAH8695588.1 hypothetical protein BGW36DRAFT_429461 [Talaromyces proteolyticus]
MPQKERPCRNCALANKAYTYAVRDRKVTVLESYLSDLEGVLLRLRMTRTPGLGAANTSEQGPGLEIAVDQFDPIMEDTTAEVFVSKPKQIPISNCSAMLGAQLESNDSQPESIRPPQI